MPEMTRRMRLLLLPSLLLVCLLGCDRVTGIAGKVQDPGGAPIEGVTVTLATEGRAPHQVTSDASGAFDVTIVGAEPKATTLTLEKAGYQTVNKMLEQDRASGVVITMSPAAAAP